MVHNFTFENASKMAVVKMKTIEDLKNCIVNQYYYGQGSDLFSFINSFTENSENLTYYLLMAMNTQNFVNDDGERTCIPTEHFSALAKVTSIKQDIRTEYSVQYTPKTGESKKNIKNLKVFCHFRSDLLTLPNYNDTFWRIFEKFGAFSGILSIFGAFSGQKRMIP